jgi:DNA polymerase sigma
MLCIEEPFDTSRNLGNSADDISIFGVRREFQRALASLIEQCNLALLCKPYIANIGPPTANWTIDNMDTDEGGMAVEAELDVDGIHKTNKRLDMSNMQTPIHNAQPTCRPPVSKVDLDNIYTDTVARVKLPSRHRSSAVKKES